MKRAVWFAAMPLALIVVAAIGQVHGAIWDSNDFIVAEFAGNRVTVFDENFTFKAYVDTAVDGPNGLDFTPSGNLMVAGRTPLVLREYDSDGNLVNNFTKSDLRFPLDVKVGPDGRIYVTSYSVSPFGIHEFSPTGASLRTFGGREYTGVAVLPSGTLWAGMTINSIIDVFDIATGSQIGAINLDHGQNGVGSMFYSAVTNTVLMTDPVTRRIYERNVDGSFVRKFESNLPVVSFGVTRGPDGNVYATSYSGDSVLKWDSDGTFLGRVGGAYGPVGIVWTGNIQSFQSSAVPEPGSFAIFGIGACLVGMGWFRRRRHRSETSPAA